MDDDCYVDRRYSTKVVLHFIILIFMFTRDGVADAT